MNGGAGDISNARSIDRDIMAAITLSFPPNGLTSDGGGNAISNENDCVDAFPAAAAAAADALLACFVVSSVMAAVSSVASTAIPRTIWCPRGQAQSRNWL